MVRKKEPCGECSNNTEEKMGMERTFQQLLFKTITQVALVVKNPPANAGDIRDQGSIPGS